MFNYFRKCFTVFYFAFCEAFHFAFLQKAGFAIRPSVLLVSLFCKTEINRLRQKLYGLLRKKGDRVLWAGCCQRSATLLENAIALHVIALCHVLRAITFRSDNGSSFDRAISFGCNNGSNELEVITFFHCAKAICNNALCNVALLL
jgi:hypothetical protein